ncbi:hypothetical protein [Longitalea arenae]|uniref:hypothetical protein n=1 Tax=Longitalea arenae TaxID=2812558 RepID=UPI001966FA4A|nr:hypothetical protein [Longitalea arenae]
MPNRKTDSRGFASNEPDQERDMAAKGGPSTGLGRADAKHGVVSPHTGHLQTQIAAKNKKGKNDKADKKRK